MIGYCKRILINKKYETVSIWFQWLQYIVEHGTCSRQEVMCAISEKIHRWSWGTGYSTAAWGDFANRSGLVKCEKRGTRKYVTVTEKGMEVYRKGLEEIHINKINKEKNEILKEFNII